jgi:glucose/arabinose dehydrogenase
MHARAFLPALVFGCVAIAACDDGSPPQSPEPGEPITGNERLGWDQQAADGVELASYRYAIYVDGVRLELADVSCASTSGSGGFACSARLPIMSAGSHTLDLAAFTVGGGVLESGRSAPLRVIVGPATVLSSAASGPSGQVITTADGVRLRLELVADGLKDPTDLSVAADGRVFVAERAGRVRIVRNGHLQTDPALTIGDIARERASELVALALDPQFERSGLMYVIYTARSDSDRAVFRLVRFREVNGTLAERAILLDEIPSPSSQPVAALRFGPDHKLYAAFDDGGDARRGGDLGSYNGKVLRLNPDGTTPPDHTTASPVYAYSLHSPHGVDWQQTTGTLWLADTGVDDVERLNVVLDNDGRSTRGAVGPKYVLPRLTGAVSMTFYRGNLIPALRDDLLIAAAEGRHILRLQFDRGAPAQIVASERLLDDQVGSLRVVGIGPRGEIYFCTATALGRLVPV